MLHAPGQRQRPCGHHVTAVIGNQGDQRQIAEARRHLEPRARAENGRRRAGDGAVVDERGAGLQHRDRARRGTARLLLGDQAAGGSREGLRPDVAGERDVVNAAAQLEALHAVERIRGHHHRLAMNLAELLGIPHDSRCIEARAGGSTQEGHRKLGAEQTPCPA